MTNAPDRERSRDRRGSHHAPRLGASLVLALVGGAGCASSPAAEVGPSRELTRAPAPDAEAAVRAAVLSISDHAGLHDFEALRSDHLESPIFTKFGPRVAQRQGFEDMIADEVEAFSAVRNLSIDFRELRVDVLGDVAIATSYPLFTFTDPNGEPAEREARMTLVYVRTSDGWKIAHEHSSPFEQ